MFHFLNKLFTPDPSKLKEYQDPNLKYTLGKPGEIGIVDEMIRGPYIAGRVHFRGSYWPARCDREIVIGPGEPVRIVGIHCITLLVQPVGAFEEPC